MTSLTRVFDPVYSIKHEFSTMEQASNPIKRVVGYACKQSCHYCIIWYFFPGRSVLYHEDKTIYVTSRQPPSHLTALWKLASWDSFLVIRWFLCFAINVLDVFILPSSHVWQLSDSLSSHLSPSTGIIASCTAWNLNSHAHIANTLTTEPSFQSLWPIFTH